MEPSLTKKRGEVIMQDLQPWSKVLPKLSNIDIDKLIEIVPKSRQRLFKGDRFKIAEYSYNTYRDRMLELLPHLATIMIKELEPEDLTHLNFSYKIGNGSCPQGSFLKTVENSIYYKMSYVSGTEVIGHESINECIANILCQQFGFEYLPYKLHYAKTRIDTIEYTSWLVSSNDYKRPNEQCVTLEIYLKSLGCNINDKKEVFEYCLRLPNIVPQRLFEMQVIDFILYNRDRHGANIELLRTNTDLRLAPIFDCGSSLLAPCQNSKEKVQEFNVLNDSPVNNFIGSMFLSEALKMWSNDFKVPYIKWSEDLLTIDKSCLPEQHWYKINNMIKNRLE